MSYDELVTQARRLAAKHNPESGDVGLLWNCLDDCADTIESLSRTAARYCRAMGHTRLEAASFCGACAAGEEDRD